MTQLIVFPDAVELVADLLRTALTPTPVVARVPNPRPASFVTVSRTGGTRRNDVVDDATITVHAWYAGSEEAAHDLAQQARAWLHATVGQPVNGVVVYRCDELAGPYLNPDPVSEVVRYTFSVQVAVRGAAQTV